MKIAYVAASVIPSWTANSVQVMKVCQALIQNGNDVTLYVPGKPTISEETLLIHYGLLKKFPIEWVSYTPVFKKIDFVYKAVQQARKQKADLVYTRLLWAAVMAQWAGLPVILEIHDRPVGRMGVILLKRFIRNKGLKRIVLITHALKGILESEYALRFRNDEVIISPDGVDLERYEQKLSPVEARKKLGLHEKPTAVYSGGFYEGRGLDTLMDLARKFPEVQFIWVGGKADVVSKWNEKIGTESIQNIRLTGFVANENISIYQMAADVLLMPYGKTISGSSGGNIADVSSPMKMFEYMAAGRVILTSDLPVLREVLNDKNAAFYIPEDNQDLYNQFSDLINNEVRRNTLASQALMDVRQYSWQERMKRILDLMKAADETR
jgi:glycosyltransferase involved in cell wall biosynthesis